MLKIAVLVWVMLGTTLAGIAVVVILNLPGLAGQEFKFLPIAAIVGFLVAIPFSVAIAKVIGRSVSA
jgi:hypothetical protein